LRASGFASAEQPACNFRETPPPAIVYAVPEFVGGISVKMPLDISRRDFLSGSALIIDAGLTPLAQLRAASTRYYPPPLTGLRGSHPGSFEVAHQLAREGKAFDFSGMRVSLVPERPLPVTTVERGPVPKIGSGNSKELHK
jgi:hypothetical protein